MRIKKENSANVSSSYRGGSGGVRQLFLTLYRIADVSEFVKFVFLRSFFSKLDEWAKRLLADRVSNCNLAACYWYEKLTVFPVPLRHMR